MDKEEFYAQVGDLLGVEHQWTPEFLYMRRWGPRTPGNGRYPGHGIIRAHSSDLIHVNLYNPPCSGHFTSYEAAIARITAILTQQPKTLL